MGSPPYLRLQSAKDGLVLEIKAPVASGSPLHVVDQAASTQAWITRDVDYGSAADGFAQQPPAGAFWIINSQGLAVDIEVPVASGSRLQGLAVKDEANQWWATELVPDQPNYFWLVSVAQSLVIDIATPVGPGSTVRVLEQKDEPNQYWTWAAVIPGSAFTGAANASGLNDGSGLPAHNPPSTSGTPDGGITAGGQSED